jgi:hypothetical protein
VGKTYRTRDGNITEIVRATGWNRWQFQADDGECYCSSGRFLSNYFVHDKDLIEEVEITRPFKLEVGKRYRTRDGEEVIKIVLHPSSLTTFPFKGDDECLYRENGSIGYLTDDLDLVEETDVLSNAEKRNVGLDTGQTHYYGDDCVPSHKVEAEEKLQDLTGGVKHDDGKPMFTCLPPDALLELGNVAALGAKKYGLHNYRNDLTVSRFLDAAMRHLLLAIKGEEKDPKDGNNHLASAAWNALAAYQTLKDHPELDDRHKAGDK